MRILWITLESIFPANTGGRIGVFKRLEQVAKGHDIYLFYPYDETDGKEGLEKYCKKIYAYQRKRTIGVLLNCLRYPYTVASRCMKQMQRDIERCIVESKIDVINVDFPHMAINLRKVSKKYNIPIVLNEHNIEWQFYREISASSTFFLKKILYRIDSKRLKKYEEDISRKIHFSAITFVSTKDRETYKQWIGSKNNLYLIPVGADEPKIFWEGGNLDDKKIIFVGKMSAQPNEEAAIWFAKKVFPQILMVYPNAKFYIVGKEPTDLLLELKSQHIIITGTVETVADYYINCDLAVLPLLHGGGVKVKLLEALSYECPIVTTSVGIEGTDFQSSAWLRIADDESSFAKACVEQLSLTGKSSIRNNIEDVNIRLFHKKYTWSSIGERYISLLQSISLGIRKVR